MKDNYNSIIAEMFSRADRDEALIQRIMKVKDILYVSASIADYVFGDGENKLEHLSRNSLTLRIYDLINEDESEDDFTMEEIEGFIGTEDDDEEGSSFQG